MPTFPYQGQPVTILGGGPLAGPYIGQPVVPVDQFGNPIAFSSNFLTLPAGWDTVWRTAKSKASTIPAWLTVIGDSDLAGAFATDWNATGAIGQLRTALLSTFTLYGDFWSVGMSTFAQASFVGTPPWVINDTAHASFSQGGYSGIVFWGSGMTNPAATFTTPYACQAFDIIWQNPFAAALTTWTYTVDGGAGQVVTNAAASAQPFPTRTSVTGLANTTHTVVITAESAANAMAIYGIATYPVSRAGGVGLGFANCSVSAQHAADFTNNGGIQPVSRSLLWQGPVNAGTPTGFGFPAAPSLAIFQLGINDCTQMFGAEIFEVAMAYMIRALRRGTPNCSILIMVSSNPDGLTSDVTSGLFTNPLSWQQYKRAMETLAASYNCAYLDIDTKWGSTGVAGGFQLATNAHPAQGGHNDIATLFKSIL